MSSTLRSLRDPVPARLRLHPVAGRAGCCGCAGGASFCGGRALPDARVVRVLRHDRAKVSGGAPWALFVGYARCFTDQQDLTAQRDAPSGLGVEADRIEVDHGVTGTNRERPGLGEALAARRAGDTLVVTKLDRLARSLPDARAIADEITGRQINPSPLVGRSTTPPTRSVGCCSTCSRWWLSSNPT